MRTPTAPGRTRPRIRRPAEALRSRTRGQRQANHNGRSNPFCARDIDRAADQLDVAASDGKSEAGTCRLGRKVRLEDPSERLFAHADASISNAQDDRISLD